MRHALLVLLLVGCTAQEPEPTPDPGPAPDPWERVYYCRDVVDYCIDICDGDIDPHCTADCITAHGTVTILKTCLDIHHGAGHIATHEDDDEAHVVALRHSRQEAL